MKQFSNTLVVQKGGRIMLIILSIFLVCMLILADYTVSYILAKDYFEKLKAPIKGFYTFEKSAHSPLFEEPAKMLHIIREDILTGLYNLADMK